MVPFISSTMPCYTEPLYHKHLYLSNPIHYHSLKLIIFILTQEHSIQQQQQQQQQLLLPHWHASKQQQQQRQLLLPHWHASKRLIQLGRTKAANTTFIIWQVDLHLQRNIFCHQDPRISEIRWGCQLRPTMFLSFVAMRNSGVGTQ